MRPGRATASPWEQSLGERVHELHPRLRDYFGAIPEGSVGRGTGVFTVVGTPRRWLWPILAILARDGVIFPVWEHDVAFEVVNSPAPNAVRAVRSFSFAGGEARMVDEVSFGPRGLVDRLGGHGRVVVALDASVSDSNLMLRSSRTWLGWMPLPRFLAPQVILTEAFDEELDLQRVSLKLRAPVIGTLYEYSGTFRYAIEAGE